MPFLSKGERSLLRAVSQLAYCNPFTLERIACERAALGSDFVEGEPVWSLPDDEPERPRANAWRIVDRLQPLLEQLRLRLSAELREEDLTLYEDGVLHLLYQRYYNRLGAGQWNCYREFLGDWRRFFRLDRAPQPDPIHTFAG